MNTTIQVKLSEDKYSSVLEDHDAMALRSRTGKRIETIKQK